jgi:hypothetical protein
VSAPGWRLCTRPWWGPTLRAWPRPGRPILGERRACLRTSARWACCRCCWCSWVPAALAGADDWRLRKGLSLRLAYDPTPRAWDYAFREIEPTYVRVLTTDGTWLGGWFGENSFVSSYPEPREMFIQTAHLMDADGSFGAEQVGTNGMYVRCDDIRAVEFVDGRPAGDDNDGTGTPGAGTDE